MQKIAGPAHSRVWASPVALNFILGGTAAGYYCLWRLAVYAKIAPIPRFVSGGLLAILLVSVGFAALALESGRPLRARYLLNPWNSSWMSREAVAAIIFIIAVIIDLIAPSPIAATVAAGAAIAFLLSQGMMVFRCTAVPVWRDPLIPVSFLSSGLAAGYGLILFNRCGFMLPQVGVAPYIDAIAGMGLIVNLVTWVCLMRRRQDHAMQAVVPRLLRPIRIAGIVGVGQLFPLVMLLCARPWSMDVTHTSRLVLAVVAALALLAGNGVQKVWLVRYMQHVCSMQLGRGKWK